MQNSMIEDSFFSNQNNNVNSNSGLTDRLIDINDLRIILGYEDDRSVRRWCEKMKVPLFTLGKKKYTLMHFLHEHITSSLLKFVDHNFNNSAEVMDAIRNDESVKALTIDHKSTATKKQKKEVIDMSEASKKFLKK